MRLFAPPPSLLLLIVASTPTSLSQDLHEPRGFPLDVKYFPEDEYFAQRDLDVQQRMQQERPVAVRKMSGDPGEKFYLDYWRFAADVGWTNQSLLSTFENAFPFHADRASSLEIFPRYLDPRRLPMFSKRDYQCPTGTYACTSISRPNSCCSTSSTCQIVDDTGLGDVGCCPAGQTCGGDLSDCSYGYTPCNGGGCCMPGYACSDYGCVQTATSTVLVAPPSTAQASTITVTSTVWTTPAGGAPIIHTSTYTTVVPPPAAPSTTSTYVPPSTSTYIPPPPPSTSTITRTTSTTTTRSSLSSYTCQTNFRSCPASLGGGCCHTDLACGSGRQCLVTSARTNPAPPVLPTTDYTTISSSTSSISYSGCPTGFYACSAYYEGGCCQVDRNCDKTSCPARASTTLLSSNSITAVAPTGSGITAPGDLLTGSCYSLWSTCAASLGGGCCPTGYACGASACSATASGGGGSQIGKQAPSSADPSKEVDALVMALAVCFSSMALGLGLWL